MIYKVTGKVIAKDGGTVVLEASNGVAYEIFTPMSSYVNVPELGATGSLFTHFVVREDGVFLYGFSTVEEKQFFLLLNTVSKIGPKSAISILSNVGKDELAAAIFSEDVARLSKIPGIGKKTAERIIVELKDKVKITDDNRNISQLIMPAVHTDVLSALVNLGYKSADCEKILAEFKDETDFQTLFKKALGKLSR